LGLSEHHVTPLLLAHEFSGFPRHHRVARRRLDVPAAFALCVGTIEIRKNGLLLLQVWKRLIDEGLSALPHLVFAGKYGWRISEFKSFLSNNPEVAAKVVVINSPTDTDLAELYAHARFCLFPSFYEGWGLPVGEAAWFDRYVIASSASSVPEVCGQLMDYGAPHDFERWVDLVRRAVREPSYVAQKEAAISAASLRTWAEVAVALRNIIEAPCAARSMS
jgi:glycosyltransferase involved in cell wall biosynthesis